MRPPSLKSIAKVSGVVGIFLLVRYTPSLHDMSGALRHSRHRRQPRPGNRERNEWINLHGDTESSNGQVQNPHGRIGVNLPGRDPKDYMKAGFDRDPSVRGRDVAETPPIAKQQSSETEIDDGLFPIEVAGNLAGPDAMINVKFCRLDFAMYHRNPSENPMFKDLVRNSNCNDESNSMTMNLESVARMKPRLVPHGFVFHQSRVGSTLTANLLGVDPNNLVFSESAPPAACVLHCTECSTERKVQLLRTILKAMGNSKTHSRMFFKLQSAQTPHMRIYTAAFPSTPWIYLFRDPVEIMVSHLGSSSDHQDSTRKRSPCLRSRRSPPSEVINQLSGSPKSVSDAEYCAAHLNYLNQAPRALIDQPKSLGRVVNYRDLPNSFIEDVLPNHFGVSASPSVNKDMIEQTHKYSKARAKAKQWESDSESKHNMASSNVQKWADTLMKASYEELSSLAKHPKHISPHPSWPTNEQNNEIDLDVVNIEQFLQSPFEETEKDYLPYPPLIPLQDILNRWSPDNPNIPDIPGIHTGTLEVLNFMNMTERKRAALLRWNEIPFLLNGVPMIKETSEKWTDEYLVSKFGTLPRKVTYSQSNHFMYFNKRRVGQYLKQEDPSYKEPTGLVDMTFKDWLAHAKEAEKASVESPHYYMQLGSRPPNQFIGEDLPDFTPHQNFFIIDPRGNRGINCRFGARSIIAEAHYDGGRNFIAMLRGAKRYVLLPPSECDNLYLYPKSHPEGRHASADWSQLNISQYPKMAKAKATEVILKAGQVLYVPSYWFHYIISLGQSAQCNSRSGNAIRGRQVVADCGFY